MEEDVRAVGVYCIDDLQGGEVDRGLLAGGNEAYPIPGLDLGVRIHLWSVAVRHGE